MLEKDPVLTDGACAWIMAYLGGIGCLVGGVGG